MQQKGIKYTPYDRLLEISEMNLEDLAVLRDEQKDARVVEFLNNAIEAAREARNNIREVAKIARSPVD